MASELPAPNPSNISSGPSVFFWKDTDTYGFLCQWYPSTFAYSSTTYNCAEQYMMYQKALFVGDKASAEQILAEKKPRKQKGLGRKVKNLDIKTYNKCKFDIVVEGNWLKFSGNEHLKKELLSTEDKELVEASPMDRIWGIGFAASFAEAQRAEWGQNLLGKALMKVRERLRAECGVCVNQS